MGSIERLDVPGRCYVYNENTVESFIKEFKYFPEGVRLLKITNQEAANISDVFFMLPLCYFYVADKTTIMQFLIGEKSRNKDLHLTTLDEKFAKEQDFLGARLTELVKCGFLMKISYEAYPEKRVTLYSATKETVELVSKKLDRRIIPEMWNSEMREYRIIGRASAGFIAAYLSRHKNYRLQEKGVCTLRASSTVVLPESVFVNSAGKEFLVGFYYSFLHHDERIFSKEQYLNSVLRRMIFCEEYSTFGSKSKDREVNLIIAVEDSDDLMRFAKALRQYFLPPEKSLEVRTKNTEKLKRIYFIGEGTILSATKEELKSFQKLFFRLGGDGRLVGNVTPEFLL